MNMKEQFSSWQEFEEFVKNILEHFDFEVEFRKVFRTDRKYEIDVIAYGKRFILCFDCKLYGQKRSRVSSLRREARKHFIRTKEFEKLHKKPCIPIIVTFFDDALLFEEGCIFVPYFKLNNFLNNLDVYLEEFGIIN